MEDLLKIELTRKRIYEFLGLDDLMAMSRVSRSIEGSFQDFHYGSKVRLAQDLLVSKRYPPREVTEWILQSGIMLTNLQVELCIGRDWSISDWKVALPILGRYGPHLKKIIFRVTNKALNPTILNDIILDMVNSLPDFEHCEHLCYIHEPDNRAALDLRGIPLFKKFPVLKILALEGRIYASFDHLVNPALLEQLKCGAQPSGLNTTVNIYSPPSQLPALSDLTLDLDSSMSPAQEWLRQTWLTTENSETSPFSALQSLTILGVKQSHLRWIAVFLQQVSRHCPKWRRLTIKFDDALRQNSVYHNPQFDPLMPLQALVESGVRFRSITDLNLKLATERISQIFLACCPSLINVKV